MTHTHSTGRGSCSQLQRFAAQSRATTGNGKVTAYFTGVMRAPATLLIRMRYAALLWGLIWMGPWLQAQATAYVQLIHTVADVVGVSSPAILDSIDVYISIDNGTTWTLAVPDFKFRQATPFTPLPANNNQLIAGIAPGNSTGPGDIALQYPIPVLQPNVYYVGAVAGTIDLSTASVDVNIYYFSPARNATTGTGASDVDILLFHASPDAGPVSYYWAYDRTQHAYVRDGYLSYRGYSSGYKTLPFDNILVLGDSADANVILPKGFYYPDYNNSFWGGQSAGVIFVSGYVSTPDPAKQLGVHIALPNGSVRPLSPEDVRRFQLIHNAADPVLAQVDIHPGGFPTSDPLQLDFRQAIPAVFLEGPAGASVQVYVSARGNTSSSLAQTTLTLPPAGQNTAMFVQGVINTSQFAANPDGRPIGLELVTLTGLQGVTPTGTMKVIPFHGATDAPTVDVEIVGVGTVTGLGYKDAGPVVTLPSSVAGTIRIKQGSAVVATFTLSAAQNRDTTGAIIFASGFLSPAGNQNGPAFGLYIVYPTGEVQPLSLVSGISREPVGEVRVSTWPVMAGGWTVAVSAGAAAELPYRLVSTTGQVLEEGTWEVPGAGSWVYTLPAEAHSAGVYLLQVGESTYRLVK